jgi:DNA-directed RNA polymerase specialized sigma24 family protein
MRTELAPTSETYLLPRGLATELEAWSTRVVTLVELVRLWIFRRSLALFIFATLLSALLLPYRQAISGSALTRALVIAGGVAGAAAFMLAHSRASYKLLSGNRIARGALALLAAALVSVVFPLHSQLWVPACGALCLLALFVPLRRMVVIDLLVLLGNLAAHAIGGDLEDVRPVAVIGLWVGIPFWTILISIANERIVDHILGLCLEQPAPSAHPRHVDAWVARSLEVLPARSASTQEAIFRVADRLTSRQKEAMLLLLVGWHSHEIAQRLMITPEEVSRLTSRAAKRAGAASKEELCAMLAHEWWNSGPAGRAHDYRPNFT